MNNQHLMSTCAPGCKACAAPVKQGPMGGFYITMGHPGFNSSANNRAGYKTEAAAVKAYRKYSGI